MDATLQKIVSDLLVRLENPLTEVTDLPFKQLGDGTIVRQICGMSRRPCRLQILFYC
jgi:hypothetical protein